MDMSASPESDVKGTPAALTAIEIRRPQQTFGNKGPKTGQPPGMEHVVRILSARFIRTTTPPSHLLPSGSDCERRQERSEVCVGPVCVVVALVSGVEHLLRAFLIACLFHNSHFACKTLPATTRRTSITPDPSISGAQELVTIANIASRRSVKERYIELNVADGQEVGTSVGTVANNTCACLDASSILERTKGDARDAMCVESAAPDTVRAAIENCSALGCSTS